MPKSRIELRYNGCDPHEQLPNTTSECNDCKYDFLFLRYRKHHQNPPNIDGQNVAPKGEPTLEIMNLGFSRTGEKIRKGVGKLKPGLNHVKKQWKVIQEEHRQRNHETNSLAHQRAKERMARDKELDRRIWRIEERAEREMPFQDPLKEKFSKIKQHYPQKKNTVYKENKLQGQKHTKRKTRGAPRTRLYSKNSVKATNQQEGSIMLILKGRSKISDYENWEKAPRYALKARPTKAEPAMKLKLAFKPVKYDRRPKTAVRTIHKEIKGDKNLLSKRKGKHPMLSMKKKL